VVRPTRARKPRFPVSAPDRLPCQPRSGFSAAVAYLCPRATVCRAFILRFSQRPVLTSQLVAVILDFTSFEDAGLSEARNHPYPRMAVGPVLHDQCSVIPGAFGPLGTWIQEDRGVSTADAWIGYLQSAFIVGYSIASVTMGHLVHRFPPFKLMSIGLLLWVCAAVMCGFSVNFWMLLVARMLSGVGEAR
jgi:Major Facilitator Superfamily